MLTGIFLAASAPAADAHMAFRGGDEIVGGALHPVTTPAHVLVLASTALLSGLRIPLALKRPLLAFATGAVAGLGLSAAGMALPWAQVILTSLALVISAGVAADWKPREGWVVALCAVSGLAIGLDSAPESGTGFIVGKTLFGTWLGMNAAVGYLSLCVSNAADKKWARTGMRVIASWILAISVLVIAFALRK